MLRREWKEAGWWALMTQSVNVSVWSAAALSNPFRYSSCTVRSTGITTLQEEAEAARTAIDGIPVFPFLPQVFV